MLLDTLTNAIADKIETRTKFPVYDNFDPTPLEQRATPFLVVGIDKVETDKPFLTESLLCYGCVIQVKLWMIAPLETEANEMVNDLYEWVVPSMHAMGYTLKEIQCGTADTVQKLQRMVLSAVFSATGIFECRRTEEVGV